MTDDSQQAASAVDAKQPDTLDSVAADFISSKKELSIGGKPLVVEPWHVAAIKAKNGIPGNREMDATRFQQLVEGVVKVSIGGPPEAPAKK